MAVSVQPGSLPRFAPAWLADPAFADDLPIPGVGLVVQYGLWVLGSVMVVVIFAVGIASLVGSRVVALAGPLVWLAVASPLLAAAPPRGVAREALMTVALEHLKPGVPGTDSVPTSTAIGVVVLMAWCVIPCALGAWRTRTRDA